MTEQHDELHVFLNFDFFHILPLGVLEQDSVLFLSLAVLDLFRKMIGLSQTLFIFY